MEKHVEINVSEWFSKHSKELACLGTGYLLGMLSCYRSIHRALKKFING